MKFNLEKFLQFENMLEPTMETLYMVGVATFFSLLIGLPVGILLVVTDVKGVKPNKTLHKILDMIIVNITRSIPFVILMVLLIPLSRRIVGKSFGTTAFIIPLALGSAPFVARIIEGALKEVDEGLIEASKSFIICRTTLVVPLPSIIVWAGLYLVLASVGVTADHL